MKHSLPFQFLFSTKSLSFIFYMFPPFFVNFPVINLHVQGWATFKHVSWILASLTALDLSNDLLIFGLIPLFKVIKPLEVQRVLLDDFNELVLVDRINDWEVFRFEVNDLRVLVQKTVEIEGIPWVELLQLILLVFLQNNRMDWTRSNNTETVVKISSYVTGLYELIRQGVGLFKGQAQLLEKLVGKVVVKERDFL